MPLDDVNRNISVPDIINEQVLYTFTEKDFLPAINALERRLEPEVRYRAQLTHADPSGPLAEFKGNIESFRGQLKNRRKFLLSELKREQ
jgi:hypothetical protein